MFLFFEGIVVELKYDKSKEISELVFKMFNAGLIGEYTLLVLFKA